MTEDESGVTLQFFGMIMPFGCALMGFATAVSAQTSWYLVVPLLFVGFEMDIFEAVVLSVLLDLCNGATLSVFNGYHGNVDWAYGSLFGVVTAIAAVPPALLLRSVIEHEQEFVKFTAAFIPAVMSIAFLVKGVKLLKLERLEREARQRRGSSPASSSGSSSSLSARITLRQPSTSSPSSASFQSGSASKEGDSALLLLGSPEHLADDVENGFVLASDEFEGDEQGEADDDPLFDAPGAEDHLPETEGDQDAHLRPTSPEDDPHPAGFEVEMFDEEPLKTAGHRDLSKMRRKGGARRAKFAPGTQLLATRPTFKFKRISIPYRGVLALTILGHVFLGIFMGIPPPLFRTLVSRHLDSFSLSFSFSFSFSPNVSLSLFLFLCLSFSISLRYSVCGRGDFLCLHDGLLLGRVPQDLHLHGDLLHDDRAGRHRGHLCHPG